MKGLGADERYWQSLGKGHVELPRCADCRRWHWPAPFRCGDCGSWDMEWTPVELDGRIFTWTRTWHPFSGTESLGLPFAPVLIELPQAGGIRLLGLLEGKGEPRIGDRVTGRIDSTKAFDRTIPSLRWAAAA